MRASARVTCSTNRLKTARTVVNYKVEDGWIVPPRREVSHGSRWAYDCLRCTNDGKRFSAALSTAVRSGSRS
jgi:hypothetical protein